MTTPTRTFTKFDLDDQLGRLDRAIRILSHFHASSDDGPDSLPYHPDVLCGVLEAIEREFRALHAFVMDGAGKVAEEAACARSEAPTPGDGPHHRDRPIRDFYEELSDLQGAVLLLGNILADHFADQDDDDGDVINAAVCNLERRATALDDKVWGAGSRSATELRRELRKDAEESES